MREFSKIVGVASLAIALGMGTALADPLNTGTNLDGSLVTPGTIDTSWTGYDATIGAAVPAFAVSGYNGAWLNQPNAEFLSPNQLNGQADNYPSSVNELINWTTSFTLSSNGAASDILGAFAVDNQLLSIVVSNANGTFTITPASGGGFGFLTAFDIPFADLVAGLNTITFDTENYASESGNPTGLLVEFTQVPEPASLADARHRPGCSRPARPPPQIRLTNQSFCGPFFQKRTASLSLFSCR